MQLLDYQSQQYRILVPLATAFAYHACGAHMRALYRKAILEGSNADSEQELLMKELHSLTSGLKATVSFDAIQVEKEVFRRSHCTFTGRRAMSFGVRWSWLCVEQRFAAAIWGPCWRMHL